METAPSALGAWESFYVIIGSSAAALTGLQFVVITLIADSRRRHTQREINAFGTPIVLHFSVVLLVAAILSAPWRAASDPAIWIVAVGVAGVVYAGLTRRRARVMTQQPDAYKPVLEDLIWYQLVPTLGYLGLLGAGVALYRGHEGALRTIAGLMLYLLLASIRNAWDTVTWVAETHGKET
ncbi:MAG TPA: hypothetical protein VGU74_12700 [Gemmatimonadales bacterium]|nr:hypothetical protein [Gemmatimonadales bacterium]